MKNPEAFNRLSELVSSVSEFDALIADALPMLLERTTTATRKFLRATDQWFNDVRHEKQALRWGYELLERFVPYARAEVPCRPLFLLDSFIAKYLSQPGAFTHFHDLDTGLSRFLDALTARAVVSRDATVALFHHLYGLGPSDVIRLLGFRAEYSQRLYKNFERWRRTGWERTMSEAGITEEELHELQKALERDLIAVNKEAESVGRLIRTHYRKSEPDHFPCKTRHEWEELFAEDYGYDYRLWHLALCADCASEVAQLRCSFLSGAKLFQTDLHLRPWQGKQSLVLLLTGGRGRP